MSNIEDFVCQRQVRPIENWIEDETEEKCNSCLLSPLAGYYLGELQDAGEDKLAKELENIFAEGDVLTIAKKLDSIKSVVGEPIRQNLLNLDCLAQSYYDDSSNDEDS